MLSYILSMLSLARHAVALTLVAGAAATTMVAGSVDQTGTQPQHQTAPMTVSVSPTTKPEPTAQPNETRSATPMSARPETSPRPEATTNDLEALVKDCLTKYAALKTSTTAGTAASDACRRAIEASGLPSTEFWTRFAPKTQPSTAPVKPSTNPSTNIEALAKDCFAKYTAARDSTTGATAASEACRRAIDASGLSATEFWAKFGTPVAPKSTPKATAAPTTPVLTQLTRYCLTMHAALTTTSSREQVERATTVCNQAIAEARLTPTEFWAKFSAYR
ncbi:MAG: hypothetical protein M3P38_11935 [Chloroflexota bacterium]|nr:hypothetical protein [Chloroflexota bacterium]